MRPLREKFGQFVLDKALFADIYGSDWGGRTRPMPVGNSLEMHGLPRVKIANRRRGDNLANHKIRGMFWISSGTRTRAQVPYRAA